MSALHISPLIFIYSVCFLSFFAGIGKECVHIEQICPVCEKDLSYISSIDSYYEDDAEPPKLPEVAVLPCGHAFHTECLMQFTEEGQSREPPCFLCNSYLD